MEYNIYCDESCHLEKDKSNVMIIGCVWCEKSKIKDISKEIRSIKEHYRARGEMKWNKISKSRASFYQAVINYFLKCSYINFRGLVVNDKSKLDHRFFNKGSHDAFYYKMYYTLLKILINLPNYYHIYFDYKDTHSYESLKVLHEILSSSFYDFENRYLRRFQPIKSSESELIQLADILIGAIGYKNRELSGNITKTSIINSIQSHLSIDLTKSTPPWEEKFNLFVFTPQER